MTKIQELADLGQAIWLDYIRRSFITSGGLQDLIDKGVLTASKAGAYSHVLSSAVGGTVAAPVIYKMNLQQDDVLLLCSDGLTTHVTDDQIRGVLVEMESSEQACRKLVSAALAGGGRDNVTVIVGRAKAA